jgi:hypothetical protein
MSCCPSRAFSPLIVEIFSSVIDEQTADFSPVPMLPVNIFSLHNRSLEHKEARTVVKAEKK